MKQEYPLRSNNSATKGQGHEEICDMNEPYPLSSGAEASWPEIMARNKNSFWP
jgi:hypothetical protein